MIDGTVTSDLDAALVLVVAGPDDNARSIEVAVDTGFNGELTLPRDIIEALALRLAGNRRAELADGTSVTLDVYLATVEWGDQKREVLALQTEGGPLVGMALLRGHRLLIDAVPGGEVMISPLP